MKTKIDLKDYIIKSKLNPVGEQAGIEALLLLMGLGVAFISWITIGIKSFYHWITFVYALILVATIINWIIERDKYLEKRK